MHLAIGTSPTVSICYEKVDANEFKPDELLQVINAQVYEVNH